MQHLTSNDSTVIGTAGGTFLALFAIPTSTVIATIVLAIIGATTSFIVSILLKELYNYIKKKFKKNG
jgi:F0F1-type ATP synthase membrane subunit a